MKTETREELKSLTARVLKEIPFTSQKEKVESIYKIETCRNVYWDDEKEMLKEAIKELVRNACNC